MRYCLVLLMLLAVVGCSAQAPQPDKPHHTERGFRNPDDLGATGFVDLLKWRWERLFKDLPDPADFDFPRAQPQLSPPHANPGDRRATWVGHATLLVQTAGKNILTDPQFSSRASPVSWAGPRRVVEPGIALAELPPIHIVLISHDHYDSLDVDTIRALRERPGGEETVFFVPLGLGGWFAKQGISRTVELDWWDSQELDGLHVTAVPARHWSKRSLFTRNRTLWAGWVVADAGFRFYFAGDSAYTPQFAEIGRRLGPFDLAAIPIGAYAPRWFMRHHHINPEEAVQVHRDVGARRSVAIHWGTFPLSDEPLDEPPVRLAAARAEQRLSDQEFVVLQHGQTLILPQGEDR